ncbi:MAG: hypothetical protein ABEJ22_01670 [Haloferacaceae archaeon]
MVALFTHGLLALASLGPLSLAGVGAMAMFDRFRGDDDETDLSAIAERLDARPTEDDIERQLAELSKNVDTIAAAAKLDRHAASPPAPDASSVEKTGTLVRALSRDDLEIRPPSPSAGGEAETEASAVSDAAADLQADRPLESTVGTDLVEALVEPEHTSRRELYDLLDEVVSRLAAYEHLESALEGGVPESEYEAQQVTDDLAPADDAVTDVVASLARESVESEADERAESELRELAATVVSLYEEETDTDVPGATPLERTRSLVAHVEENGFGEDETAAIAAVAERVDNVAQPEGETAQTLLRTLQSGDREATYDALERTVEDLELAATTRSVVGGVDRDTVLADANGLASEAASLPTPVASELEARIEELAGVVRRSHDSNVVAPYWVSRELSFYEGTLFPAVERARADDDADVDVEARVEELTAERERIESQHVEAKPDHNHSIPLHFLSLFDELVEESSAQARRGDAAAAAGLLDAASELLSAVEDLYVRNQYSVMLRSLRG